VPSSRDQLLGGTYQPKPYQPPKLLYKTSEAMVAIGCGVTKFYELVNAGVLDVRRFGRRTLVTAESLEAFVASLPRAMTPTMAKAERAAGHATAEPQSTAAE
jgi:hypothetical protein